MHKIVIEGGKKLRGTVRISGSKNAALPILVASLLTDDECVVEDVPSLADIDTTIGFLTYIGKRITRAGNRVKIGYGGKLKDSAPYDLVRKMRASVLVMGPLLARLGKVRVSLPGGCAIGARPIDIHLDSFAKLGADIEICEGYVQTAAMELNGTRIVFRFPSVGATENVLLASVLARGTTIIENAAREPEIADLADVLNKMGACVRGAGTRVITVKGVEKLCGFRHRVIPDRIEAATFLVAAAITRGDITIENCAPGHLRSIIDKLKKSGVSVTEGRSKVRTRWVKELKPVSVTTAVYPGFPTDVQAQWMALMATTGGTSAVKETVFENRLMHVPELQRLGADLRIDGNKVYVRGAGCLSGAPVMVSDLRAGAALVLAGLAAVGKTVVSRVYHLDRGYEHLEKKLRLLGARIRRVAQ